MFMIIVKRIAITIFSLHIGTSDNLLANEQPYTEESKVLLEQLQENIKGTLLSVVENEQKAGREIDSLYYLLDLPSSMSTNLGFILDMNDYQQGYKILHVSPGSTAEALSLKMGDRLIGFNNEELNQQDKEKAMRQLSQITAGQIVKLAIMSNRIYKEVSTQVKGQFIPSIRLEIGSPSSKQAETSESANVEQKAEKSIQCGEVSVFFRPPSIQKIYPVNINKIDHDHRKRYKHSFRLPVGKHTIYLNERINDPMFPIRRTGVNRRKPIEINIKANTTYYLGALFNRAKRFTTANGAHWEPVVWKTSDKKCSL